MNAFLKLANAFQFQIIKGVGGGGYASTLGGYASFGAAVTFFSHLRYQTGYNNYRSLNVRYFMHNVYNTVSFHD